MFFPYLADVRASVGGVSDDNEHERSGDSHGRLSPGHEPGSRLREQGAVKPLKHFPQNVLEQSVQVT
jgi:hypothetical protein